MTCFFSCVNVLSHQFPEALGHSRCNPSSQSPSPTRYIHTHLGQHLSTQGKQLPFCSATGAEQVKGVPSESPPTRQSPWDLEKECQDTRGLTWWCQLPG